MKHRTIAFALATLLVTGSASLFAQRGHGGGMGRAPSGAGAPTMPAAGATANAHATGAARAEPAEHRTPSEVLAQNTQLSARLQTLLPAGESAQKAASGFKNFGQFAAAAHVSHNLNIPFDQLKAKMTGPQKLSLGQAIHELDAKADSKAAVKKAKKQAHADMEMKG
jgi:hypothetical protein